MPVNTNILLQTQVMEKKFYSYNTVVCPLVFHGVECPSTHEDIHKFQFTQYTAWQERNDQLYLHHQMVLVKDVTNSDLLLNFFLF